MLPTEIPTQIAETGTALAGIAIATAIVLAGMVLAAGVYIISLRLEQRLEARPGTAVHLVENAIVAVRRPLSLGIAVAAVYVALHDVLGLQRLYPWFDDPRLPETIAIVFVAWGAASFISHLVQVSGSRRLPAVMREDGSSLTDLAAVAVKYLVWFIAILYLLIYLDISIAPLVAGAGIAGIAVALAAQDVLSNLFGGVIILLDRPLGVGDKVRIDPYVGTVLRIGLRSTRIRTLDGLIATVPNSRITTNIVVNYTAGAARSLVQVPVTADYATPVAESRTALYRIARATVAAAPDDWELGEGTVQIAELGRFGPVFLLTFPARDQIDPLVVKDAVYALVAEDVRAGRLAIGFGRGGIRSPEPVGGSDTPRRPDRVSGGVHERPPGEHDEGRERDGADRA